MKLNRWIALPVAAGAALAVGIAAVAATPSPSATAGKNYADVFVDKLAHILNLDHNKTQDALKQAQLQTIDQMQKDGKITQEQANALKSKIQSGNGLGFGFGHFRGDKFGVEQTILNDVHNAQADAIAKALGLTTAELKTQIQSGRSLSDLETAKGVSDQTVQTAAKNAAKSVLDKAVADKKITQDQENAILSRLANKTFGFGHRHRQAPPSAPGQPGASF
jgi:polyhydroxyalkanoate synthesis regulator phasin